MQVNQLQAEHKHSEAGKALLDCLVSLDAAQWPARQMHKLCKSIAPALQGSSALADGPAMQASYLEIMLSILLLPCSKAVHTRLLSALQTACQQAELQHRMTQVLQTLLQSAAVAMSPPHGNSSDGTHGTTTLAQAWLSLLDLSSLHAALEACSVHSLQCFAAIVSQLVSRLKEQGTAPADQTRAVQVCLMLVKCDAATAQWERHADCLCRALHLLIALAYN